MTISNIKCNKVKGVDIVLPTTREQGLIVGSGTKVYVGGIWLESVESVQLDIGLEITYAYIKIPVSSIIQE